MTLVSLAILCVAGFWTYMIWMVLVTAYHRQWKMGRRFRLLDADRTLPKSCLLIRPCSGEDAEQLDCLTSVVRARRDFPLRVIIGVDSDDDPAVPSAKQAVEILNREGIPSSLEVLPVIGPNRKVSILAGCVSRVRGENDFDLVLSADSNTDLSGFDLTRFVAPLLQENGTAAIWAPPRVEAEERDLGNLASEAVLHGSWHSFGLLGAIDPRGMVGKLFAVTREALDAVGGFEGMVRYLGEDMEMSRRLRSRGLKVERYPSSVRTTASRMTWSETLARHARWMMVIKAQRPRLMLSYPLLFFNTPIVSILCLAGMLYSVPAALVCLLCALLLRLLVGASAARMLGLRSGLPTLVAHAVVGDGLLLVAFLKSLRMRTVEWRGRALTFTGTGEIATE